MHAPQTSTDAAVIRASRLDPAEFSDGYAETLDLDAQTGVLVHMSGGTIGRPENVDVTYRVTRVTAPSLEPAH